MCSLLLRLNVTALHVVVVVAAIQRKGKHQLVFARFTKVTGKHKYRPNPYTTLPINSSTPFEFLCELCVLNDVTDLPHAELVCVVVGIPSKRFVQSQLLAK